MIDIKIPELSDKYKVPMDLKSLPRNVGGLYFFYSQFDELLYLGRSKDLYNRVRNHLSGLSNTKGFYKSFHYVRYFINESIFEQEIYAINILKPKFNISRSYQEDPVPKQIIKTHEIIQKEKFAWFVVDFFKVNKNREISIHMIREMCRRNEVEAFSFIDDTVKDILIKNDIVSNGVSFKAT